MSDQPVTDENLRLVFSERHEEWLNGKIRTTQREIWRYLVVIVLAFGWFGICYLYVANGLGDRPECVELDGGATLEQVIAEGLVPEGTRECTGATLSDRPYDGWIWPFIEFIGAFGILYAIYKAAVALAEGARSYVLLRGYRRDLREHRTFLEKYNRGESPATN